MINWLRRWISATQKQREARRLARQAIDARRASARRAAQRQRARETQDLLTLARAAIRSPFIIADLKTTGFSLSDEILSIAAIRVNEDGQIADELSLLIRIRSGLPQHIVELTGISNRMLARESVTLRVALDEFGAFCQDDPVFFHNASYNLRMLEAACARTLTVFTNKVLCSLKIARAAWPHLPSHQLTPLAKYVGAPAPTHRGLDNVYALRHVLLAALSDHPLAHVA